MAKKSPYGLASTALKTLTSISKSDFDDSEPEEYVQVVRKAVVPINELVDNVSKLKKLKENETYQVIDYKKAHLLDGVPLEYHDFMVKHFNAMFEQTHLFKQDKEYVYVPLVYRVCFKFFELDQKDVCAAFLEKLNVIDLVQNFNKTLLEVESVLKANFSGINTEEVIVDLFSQSYVHNFIELQNLFKTINSEL